MVKVTQEMIAQRLGISRTAVAAGLGLYRGKTVALTEETKQRIVEAAREMGYRPNRFAQNVAGRNTGVIGVMSFGGISQAATQRVKETSEAIRAVGYEMLLHEVAWESRENATLVVHSLIDYHVEALILIEPTDWFDFSTLAACQRNAIPVVSMGGLRTKEIPHIAADEYAGIRELTAGLIARGARHFTFLSPLYSKSEYRKSNAYTRRGEGFVDAILEGGGKIVEPSADSVPKKMPKSGIIGMLTDAPSPNWSDPYLPGYLGMKQVLEASRLPDAVICSNDDWAFGALRCCREAGLRVPEDLWLTGNDGLIISAYGETPLTTIEQPMKEMAAATVALILQMLAGKRPSKKDFVQHIAPTVIWRRSTEALPGKRKSPASPLA